MGQDGNSGFDVKAGVATHESQQSAEHFSEVFVAFAKTANGHYTPQPKTPPNFNHIFQWMLPLIETELLDYHNELRRAISQAASVVKDRSGGNDDTTKFLQRAYSWIDDQKQKHAKKT